jgi:hypothetical protein
MTWNDVVTNVRDKLRRGLGRGGSHEIQVAHDGARLEQLGDVSASA